MRHQKRLVMALFMTHHRRCEIRGWESAEKSNSQMGDISSQPRTFLYIMS